jgi:hypothetical protein
MFGAEPVLEGVLDFEEEPDFEEELMECTSRLGSMNPILGRFGATIKNKFLAKCAAFVKADCSNYCPGIFAGGFTRGSSLICRP